MSDENSILLFHNYYARGRAYKEHGIAEKQVFERNKTIADGSPILWVYAKLMIGYF